MITPSEFSLDEIGWRILRELQNNGRLSFAELGRAVGLSTPAVVERVRKMEDAGIIAGYRAEISAEKMGLPITAYIRMSIGGGEFTKITALLKECDEVVECHRVTGSGSFIIKAHAASIAHLEKLIDRLTPYGTTETSLVLSSPVTRRSIEKAALHHAE